ncbi:MAG: ABC transporter substrate-binding protein [Alphaproteobacteria bacterium]|nr:ABC transporter substrate-binding protein [Alphaproteobacteria bacterium]
MSSRPPLNLGLLRLADAAPAVIAFEKGFFARRDLDVRLCVEPSWANVADKLSVGQIQAAVMLPPLAFAISLGLRGIGAPLVVPMSLSLNGNTVTVSNAVTRALGLDGRTEPSLVGERLREHLRTRRARFRFAVVHVYSTHNLLLRYWLAACGIDPESDVDFVVVPPAETVEALRRNDIDGFCAGAPWGKVAESCDVGSAILRTSQIWHNHPEKCLAVSSRWADDNPAMMEALLDAMIEAARFCDSPDHADEVAALLSRDDYLCMSAGLIRASLPAKASASPPRADVDRSIFFANAANFPWRSHAMWFADQMARWGYVPTRAAGRTATAIYRPDMFRAAARRCGASAPVMDSKSEGAHGTAWSADGSPEPLTMQPDTFCDGRVFEVEP